MTKTDNQHYQFQLLRYAPNLVSGEHVNIGVFLFDAAGRMLDARFARDFRRLRCNPLADLEYLEALRNEFEEQRLLGEGFSAYGEQLRRDLSATLQISDQQSFWGGDATEEMERLYRSYVATPPSPRHETPENMRGTRRALRRQMDETFRRYHLFGANRLARDVDVPYGGGRLQFTFDYGYAANGAAGYLHGIALRNDVRDASRLCFAIERLRAREQDKAALNKVTGNKVTVTVVVDDQAPRDTLDLLEDSEVRTWQASKLDDLALTLRGDLGL